MHEDAPAATLREQLAADEIAVMPGSYDALSASLAASAGFETVFTSGFSLSASLLGEPDLGLLTMSENIDRTRAIARSIDVPLVADMDTGYGNALNVRRTVDEVIDAGVAGIILEDQEWPKRCGHMRDKRVVSAAAHARRISAAADVRAERDTDLVIIGRTDAREAHDMDEAIRRGHLYADAGADVVFVEAPQTRQELERVASSFDQPTFANMIEGGQTPYLSPADLEAIGFDIVVYPLSALFAATHALRKAYETLATEGTTAAVDTVSFEEFEAVIGAPEMRSLEDEYSRRFTGEDE